MDSRAGFRQLIDGWDGIPTCFFFLLINLPPSLL